MLADANVSVMTSVVKQFSKLRTRWTRRTWEPWDILSTRFLRLTLYISLSSRRLRFSVGFIFLRFLIICIISSFRCKKTERLFVVKVKSCFKVELHFFLPVSNMSFAFYVSFGNIKRQNEDFQFWMEDLKQNNLK